MSAESAEIQAVNLAETTGAPEGLWLIEPSVFSDERGYFYESFNAAQFSAAIGQQVTFVQDNHALSDKGVARGLHYQLPPSAQGKLVRVARGEAFDVAVDIRKNSPSFGQWYGVILSEANHKQLWIPEGFAHGYVALSDETLFLYKTTDYYAPKNEASISFFDSDIGIILPEKFSLNSQNLRFSAKDSAAPTLRQAKVF